MRLFPWNHKPNHRENHWHRMWKRSTLNDVKRTFHWLVFCVKKHFDLLMFFWQMRVLEYWRISLRGLLLLKVSTGHNRCQTHSRARSSICSIDDEIPHHNCSLGRWTRSSYSIKRSLAKTNILYCSRKLLNIKFVFFYLKAAPCLKIWRILHKHFSRCVSNMTQHLFWPFSSNSLFFRRLRFPTNLHSICFHSEICFFLQICFSFLQKIHCGRVEG